ncbi:hypothetical protein GDO81_000090 [Engystomops pustulosus]|uniref:Uncharacterized protein n=1 Tax=Engystomops pustulosus TaxID=76066 RepID=A0AAV7D205_ENGPU|nr:hypothetical protein GDO81_000090 [Engystomops pustulosus]
MTSLPVAYTEDLEHRTKFLSFLVNHRRGVALRPSCPRDGWQLIVMTHLQLNHIREALPHSSQCYCFSSTSSAKSPFYSQTENIWFIRQPPRIPLLCSGTPWPDSSHLPVMSCYIFSHCTT